MPGDEFLKPIAMNSGDTNGFVIRGNVIHDTTIGTRSPCIFVYGNDGDNNPTAACSSAL